MKIRLQAITCVLLLAGTSTLTACFTDKAKISSVSEFESTRAKTIQKYQTLVRSAMLETDEPVLMEGTNHPLTFGAEKEGSSSLITRIAGPSYNHVKSFLFDANYKSQFIRMIEGWRDGGHRADEVNGEDGSNKALLPSSYSGDVTIELAQKWFADAGDTWLLQFKPSARQKLFLNKFPGVQPSFQKSVMNNFGIYKPFPGEAAKYIHAVAPEGFSLWELRFTPQKSLGEFEKMISWFRKVMERKVDGEKTLYSAPGHIRIGFSLEGIRKLENDYNALQKVGELGRLAQSWMMFNLLAIESNAITSKVLKPAFDEDFTPQKKNGKWVIDSSDHQRHLVRTEHNRFTHYGFDYEHMTFELRSGLKDKTRRVKILSMLGARLAALDFDGIADVSSYSMITNNENLNNKCIQKAKKIRTAATYTPTRFTQFFAGLRYDKVPWIASKAPYIQKLVNGLEDACAELDDGDLNGLKTLLHDAAAASSARRDIEHMLRPVNGIPLDELVKVPGSSPVNVNEIDLGIEFSARFPTGTLVETSEDRFIGRKDWLSTAFTFNTEERVGFLFALSRQLANKLGGDAKKVSQVQSPGDAHGHGIEQAFKLKDSKDRSWRVEWDGIGRSYDGQGEMIKGSLRGGHIELVTPKFVPEMKAVQSVFEVFDSLGISANRTMGGGHINIDLAPFECDPQALARMLTVFHRNRDIISMLFQAPNRLKSAEPLAVSQKLANELANFNGGSDDLKKLLYRNKYFNMRTGRKSRYVQFEVSSYFQDVIPSRLITQDFDINNVAAVPWRPTFRVDPRIRKAEMRLFNAPRNEAEATLQIRLVRSMLNIALNGTNAMEPVVAKVDFMKMTQNMVATHNRFKAVMNELGLPSKHYEHLFWESMIEADKFVSSKYYRTPKEVFADFPQSDKRLWGMPLIKPRPAEKSLVSEERPFNEYGREDAITDEAEERVSAYTERSRQIALERLNSRSCRLKKVSPAVPEKSRNQLEPEVSEIELTMQIQADTKWGDKVYLAGEHATIGNWSADNALELTPISGDPVIWEAKVKVPAGSSFDYKFFILKENGDKVWEDKRNNRELQGSNKSITLNNLVFNK